MHILNCFGKNTHILNSFWRLGSQGQISHTWFSKRRKVPVINHFSKKINQLSPWVPPSPLHHIYFSSPPPIMPSRHQHNYERERECTAAGANGEAMRPRLRRPRPILRLLNRRRWSLLRGAIRRYLHLLLFLFFFGSDLALLSLLLLICLSHFPRSVLLRGLIVCGWIGWWNACALVANWSGLVWVSVELNEFLLCRSLTSDDK